ncbi:MAG: methionyl-tRNA formyltransferase [Patescibacteria group bacterium]|jgi:methionyl-tRNA formyltransferase|nr:methionyl-tRNA formyltransferase [Patescibacteria group bacterium]
MSTTKNKKKILFMGTPEFSCPGLKSLIEEDDFEVVAVYTQADKAVGRKQEIQMPAVKKLALENNISVFQPQKIKDEVENIKKLNPDLIVVIAYGKIIPQSILDIPKYSCINVHASLLPKYRGASCLNAPIINGDKETGITIMKMEAGLDTGPILKQFKIDIKSNEKLETLHDKLSDLAANNLVETLKDWMMEKIEAQEQDDSRSSYVSIIKKEDGKIDVNKPANEIERMIRAFNPWPGTYANLNDKPLKILEAEVEKEENNKEIGEFYLQNKDLYLKCGQNSLHILKLQLPGKRSMTTTELLNGNKDIVGNILK